MIEPSVFFTWANGIMCVANILWAGYLLVRFRCWPMIMMAVFVAALSGWMAVYIAPTIPPLLKFPLH